MSTKTIKYSDLPPVCEECGIEMSSFYNENTGQDGWSCDDCGWEFLEETEQ
jgi:tRNA(Ile2) C34 agmatinyltransferase TiaS